MRLSFKKTKNPPPGQTRRRAVTPAAPAQPVFSYHAYRTVQERDAGDGRHAALESPSKQRRAQRWGRRLPGVRTIALGVLLLALVITSLSLNPAPNVVPLGSQSARVFLRPLSTYQAATAKLFASSYLNRNKITVNNGNIAAQLQQQFPELATVSISLPIIGHRPTVYILPVTPRLILSGAGGSFVLDGTGRALVDSTQLPPAIAAAVPTVLDQSGLPLRAGQIVLPSASVQFIGQVTGQLQAGGAHVAGLTLPAGASELDVHLADAPYVVKFNLRADPRQEAGAFLAVKQQLSGQHITPSQYVDVRVDGRAYYK